LGIGWRNSQPDAAQVFRPANQISVCSRSRPRRWICRSPLGPAVDQGKDVATSLIGGGVKNIGIGRIHGYVATPVFSLMVSTAFQLLRHRQS